MGQLITFLGGGSQRQRVAVAATRWFGARGRPALLVTQPPAFELAHQLGVALGPAPVSFALDCDVVQLQAVSLMEQQWEDLKSLEAQYLKSPFFKDVYGQELSIFPGLDSFLVLNALRGYLARYEAVIYCAPHDLEGLRLLGLPTTAEWYYRRFRQVFESSDLNRALAPFVIPLTAAVTNFSLETPNLQQPLDRLEDLFTQAQALLADPQRLLAYLVTDADPVSVTAARWLWGSAQQVNVRVRGVLGLPSGADLNPADFAPLPIYPLAIPAGVWEVPLDQLPDFGRPAAVPDPVRFEADQVFVFLPGFTKAEVKLTQYGPGLTIEAGDQRHNINLPPTLKGRPIRAARFQDSYLIIQF
ncbi:MAG: ArsA family ATPase [Gloeomargaritaceae cyanobacterium C42_A2020_066]|nr:ArsA family ATPase [Gloeomargaritaceae cyanobacterium C42_A2020_066]